VTYQRIAQLKDRIHQVLFGLGGAALLGTLTTSAALAQSAAASDDSLTWHGITLYGIVDVGLQYETHGAPISPYFPAGSNDIVQPDSNRSVFGVTPAT